MSFEPKALFEDNIDKNNDQYQDYSPKILMIEDEIVDNKQLNSSTLCEPKPLNIVEEAINTKNFPKHLDIECEISEKKKESNQKTFLYSFEYLKSHIPNIKKDYYDELTISLLKIDRTNNSIKDNDILEIGKELQREIGDFTRLWVGENAISTLINNINESHKNMVEKLEKSNKSKNLLDFVKNKLYENQPSDKMTNQELISLLNMFVLKNTQFKRELNDTITKFEYVEKQLNNLTQKILFYIDFFNFFEKDIIKEGFECNVDFIKNRLENVLISSTMFATTKQILLTQRDRVYMLIDNIDNVINILIPTYISKLKISELGDNSLNELSNTIINKLRS